MYFLLGISLSLSFLMLVNVFAAIAASGMWRMIAAPASLLSVSARARLIFALRVFPVTSALLFVLAFLLPSYLLHEPRSSGESVSWKLASIALISTLGVCMALYRVVRTWLVTRRLVRTWMHKAKAINVEGVTVPVYRIAHTFPVLCVVGIFRPRIFVAEKVLASLTKEEFQAAVADEHGHLKAKDNFKRTMLRMCRDMIIFPMGSDLDEAWSQNAESVADEYAAMPGPSRALDLASALIKIVRIVPKNGTPPLPIGAYMIADKAADVSTRIRRLLRLSSESQKTKSRKLPSISTLSPLLPLLFVTLALLYTADQRLLLSTHNAIESFVRLIQ